MGIGEVLDMGRYGPFIWASYATSAIVLTGLVALVLRRNARTRTELARIEARAARERDPAADAARRARGL